ncbi:MAG: hypothetical protein J6V63_06160 [Spirochaetaceae bacterium]|nr:hypothetical protein [Spirochaetaceae bacterium]
MKRNILFFTLFVLLNMMATGETFRIHKTVMVEMPETGNVVVQAGINDALAIVLPEDTTFFQGVELDIKIPEVLSRYYGSVAYSLYTDLTPMPTAATINYTGTREMIDTIPGRLSLNLILPLVEPNTIKKTPYNIVLPAVYNLNSAVLFFRFQLVMKGIPEDYEKEPFVVTVKPVYIDKGRMELQVTYPQNEDGQKLEFPYTVFIDEELATLEDGKLILDTGTHYISMVSDHYRNETRTFSIESGKTTRVEVELRDIAPTLQFVAPDNTKIFLDEIEIPYTKDAFVISQGEHQIRFVVGDYETVKTIQAVNGRSYVINLSLDVEVTETL